MADPPEDPPAGEFPALPKAFNPLAAGAIGQLLDALRDGKTFSIDSPKKPSAGDTSVARRLWQSRIGQPVPPKPIDEAAELAQLAQMMKMAPDALVAASSGGWTLAFGSAPNPAYLATFARFLARLKKIGPLGHEAMEEAARMVALHKGLLPQQVNRMSLPEFNDAFDEAKGQAKWGPDQNQPILYWDGQPCRLTPRNWEFLKVVWGRYRVPYAEIGERIWGHDDTKAGTVRQWVNRVNNELTKHGIDLAFSSEGERVSPIRDWPK